VGLVLYREPLAGIVRHKLVGTIPDHGERATAFWFLTNAPVLWMSGRLLRAAEDAGDLRAQRVAGGVLIGTGLAGAAAMPVSPFAALVVIGVAAIRRGAGAAELSGPTR